MRAISPGGQRDREKSILETPYSSIDVSRQIEGISEIVGETGIRCDARLQLSCNARFLLNNLYANDPLYRSWREGQAKHNAYLEDYAGLILALLALYQSDPNKEWYLSALKLADEMVDHFADPNGGFFDTRDDHETLLVRPKDIQDNATPSGNALAATALLKLAAYGDRKEWRDLAEEMLSSVYGAMLRYPTAFAQWLCAADFAVGPTREVAIIGNSQHIETKELLNTLWKTFRPGSSSRERSARSSIKSGISSR